MNILISKSYFATNTSIILHIRYQFLYDTLFHLYFILRVKFNFFLSLRNLYNTYLLCFFISKVLPYKKHIFLSLMQLQPITQLTCALFLRLIFIKKSTNWELKMMLFLDALALILLTKFGRYRSGITYFNYDANFVPNIIKICFK